jgi:hypothetical protein
MGTVLFFIATICHGDGSCDNFLVDFEEFLERYTAGSAFKLYFKGFFQKLSDTMQGARCLQAFSYSA